MLSENGMVREEQKDRTIQQEGSSGHGLSLEADFQRLPTILRYPHAD